LQRIINLQVFGSIKPSHNRHNTKQKSVTYVGI
jgi:hypothetical protein